MVLACLPLAAVVAFELTAVVQPAVEPVEPVEPAVAVEPVVQAVVQVAAVVQES